MPDQNDTRSRLRALYVYGTGLSMTKPLHILVSMVDSFSNTRSVSSSSKKNLAFAFSSRGRRKRSGRRCWRRGGAVENGGKVEGAQGCAFTQKKDVTAYTCLGYTNRQMAGRMCVSPYTVKDFVCGVPVSWQVPRKSELRLLRTQRDFSAWVPKALD
jgi:hypothetical protein